jgi:UDP-N-acetylmuramate dehydrogenase
MCGKSGRRPGLLHRIVPMIDNAEFNDLFAQALGRPLRRNEPLAGHAFFRIGGPADFYFQAETLDELRAAVRTARRAGLRFRVIGGGANLLFDDAGFRGLIIRNAASSISPRISEPWIEADSGTPLELLVESAAACGLGGLEFLAGIPGTVGGAVFGNAGAFGRAIGDVLADVALLGAEGGESKSTRGDLGFAYRHSVLKSRPDILLRASFGLAPADPAEIQAQMAANLALRARRHPDRGAAYPGSYFKNPTLPDGCRQAAGLLLEQAGVRGLRSGGAAVFSGHCNFIINEGGAKAADVRTLAAEMKKRVLDKFGIELEEEVIFLPAAGPGS